MNLTKCNIKDLGTVVTGNTPPTSQRKYYGNLYPLIKPTDMKIDERYIGYTQESLSEEGYKLFENKLLPKNTPCVVTIGTIGKLCLTKEPSFCNQAVNSIIVDQRFHDPMYIFYLMKITIPTVKFLSSGTASGRENVSKSAFEGIEVEVPTLPIQKKIASILSVYDDLIENNTRRIEILEQMAKLVYEEWFVKFRFPGHENVKMIPSELGEIPEGWKVKNLSDLCNKVIDGTHDSPKPAETGYFLVTGKHIVNGFIDFSKCYRISPEEHDKVIKRSKPEKGDIIFSNIGTLGSTVIVDQDFEFSIKNVALFKPLEDIYSSYLYLYFSSPETYNLMMKKASGTSQRFFSLEFLRNLEMIEPPRTLLHKFDKIIKPLIEERSLLNKKNQNLRKTRDLLLPKLISGEIDVSDLDIHIRNEFQES